MTSKKRSRHFKFFIFVIHGILFKGSLDRITQALSVVEDFLEPLALLSLS